MNLEDGKYYLVEGYRRSGSYGSWWQIRNKYHIRIQVRCKVKTVEKTLGIEHILIPIDIDKEYYEAPHQKETISQQIDLYNNVKIIRELKPDELDTPSKIFYGNFFNEF